MCTNGNRIVLRGGIVMKKALSIIMMVLICCCFLPAFMAGCADAQQKENNVYHIACMAPFTGNNAQYGTAYRNAIELVVGKVNDAGGINGHKIEITYFDDMNDPKETVSCSQLVVADEKEFLACVGPWSSTCALAAAPIFQDEKIPLLAPNCSHVDFTKIGDYMVRGSNLHPWNNQFTADYLYNTMGVKTISIIYANDDAGNAVNKYLVEYFEKLGGKVLVSESYLPGEKDFNAILSNIKSNYMPELLAIHGGYADAATIKMQADNLEIDCKIMMWGQAVTDELFDILGDKAEGIVFLSSFDPNKKNEAFQSFKTEYEEFSNGTTMNLHAYHTAEIVNMLMKAIEEVGPDRAAIAKFMRNVDGVMGIAEPIHIVEGDMQRNLNPITVEDGKFVSLLQ